MTQRAHARTGGKTRHHCGALREETRMGRVPSMILVKRSHRLGLDPIIEADFQVFDARNVADEVGDHAHGG
jgi:hypothetical protein